MGTKTALTRASTRGNSLRTTVPQSIVSQFDLQEGDKLDWTLRIKGSKLVIEVEPKKRKQGENTRIRLHQKEGKGDNF